MRDLFKVSLYLTCLIITVIIHDLNAQYQIQRSVIGSGIGYISDSTHSIKSTLGQPVIGTIGNNNYSYYTGFWHWHYGYLYNPIFDEMDYVLPKQFKVFQNYPNPFNPSTKIKYSLPKAEKVIIEVYNILGQKIETLLNIHLQAGFHEIEYNAQNLPSGVYLYRINAGAFQDVKKMMLLR